MSQHRNGKGSARRPGKPGAYADGWERIFGKGDSSKRDSLKVSKVRGRRVIEGLTPG